MASTLVIPGHPWECVTDAMIAQLQKELDEVSRQLKEQKQFKSPAQLSVLRKRHAKLKKQIEYYTQAHQRSNPSQLNLNIKYGHR